MRNGSAELLTTIGSLPKSGMEETGMRAWGYDAATMKSVIGKFGSSAWSSAPMVIAVRRVNRR